MRCPKCGLLNPRTAIRCDCGYDFQTGVVKESYLADKGPPVKKGPPVLASLGERCLGRFLDLLILGAAATASGAAGIADRSLAILGSIFCLLYFHFADGLSEGQSWGKRAMKIAVVDATTGAPCTFKQSFIRHIVMAFGFLGLGILDLAFIFGEKKQRLGDKAANTIVIKIKSN